MKRRTVLTGLLSSALALGALTAPAAAAAPGFRYLPLPAGATGGSAVDITSSGTVFGHVSTPTGAQAVKWSPGGAVRALEPADGRSTLVDANDRGAAVGHRTDPDGRRHAVLWDRGGRVELAPPGAVQTDAYTVNNRGEVLVQVIDQGQGGSGAVWQLWRAGTWRPIGDGSTYKAVLGENGHVAASGPSGTTLVYPPGSSTPTALATSGWNPQPVAVSPTGAVVISHLWTDFTTHLRVWPGHGTELVDVSMPLGHSSMWIPADHPNRTVFTSSGELVGVTFVGYDTHTQGFRWDGAKTTDLTEDLAVYTTHPVINERGTTAFSTCPMDGAQPCTLRLDDRRSTPAEIIPTTDPDAVTHVNAVHGSRPWVVGQVESGSTGLSRPYTWRTR